MMRENPVLRAYQDVLAEPLTEPQVAKLFSVADQYLQDAINLGAGFPARNFGADYRGVPELKTLQVFFSTVSGFYGLLTDRPPPSDPFAAMKPYFEEMEAALREALRTGDFSPFHRGGNENDGEMVKRLWATRDRLIQKDPRWEWIRHGRLW